MANEILDMPNFRLIKNGKWGKLKSSYSYKTRIEGLQLVSPYIILWLDGTLLVKENFEWNFGSGPAVDTPAMVAASCIHDALYTLMDLGLLGPEHQRDSDKTFKDILKHGGTAIFRRYYCYVMVRIFGRSEERLTEIIKKKLTK